MENKLAILVVSCDKYKDTWKIFFDLLKKNWSSISYNIYLGNNTEKFDFEINSSKINIINVGEDISWADNYNKMLDYIEEDYVLTFLDDFFFTNMIVDNEIEQIFKVVVKENIDCLTLTNSSQGSLDFKDYNNLRIIDNTVEYIINSGVNIWKKTVLKSFLKTGYSAWEFELKNSKEINEIIEPFELLFVSVNRPLFNILNGIIRGKWVPKTIKSVRNYGVQIDLGNREFLSFREATFENAKYRIRALLPDSLRKFIKYILIKIGFKNLFVSSKYLT